MSHPQTLSSSTSWATPAPGVDAHDGSWQIQSLSSGTSLLQISRNQMPLDEEIHNCITAVTVSLAANQQASFSLEINDPELELIDRAQGPFSEGQALDIALRNADMGLSTVISGTVGAISVELDEDDGLRVEVEGYDALRAAAAGNIYMQYQDQWSDFHVLSAIADTLRLELSIDSATRQAMSSAPVRARLQPGLSNLDFTSGLAEEYGCDFWVVRRTLYFRRETPGRPIQLQRGLNLFRIAFRLNTNGQVSAVEGRAWDTQSASEVMARALGKDRKGYWKHLSPLARTLLGDEAQALSLTVRDLAEAERKTEAEMRRLARNLVTAEGSTYGNPEMTVGSVVELSNMGRFDGEYLVQTVRHSIDKDGFRTHFTLCLHV